MNTELEEARREFNLAEKQYCKKRANFYYYRTLEELNRIQERALKKGHEFEDDYLEALVSKLQVLR